MKLKSTVAKNTPSTSNNYDNNHIFCAPLNRRIYFKQCAPVCKERMRCGFEGREQKSANK